MKGISPLWRSRLPVLAALAAVILVDVALLVSYRTFYDTRVRALVDTRHTLEAQRDELRARVEKLSDSQKRIEALRDGLEDFFGETLGTRKERLIPLIDEIHQRTRKAGLVPKSIGYAEAQGAGDLDAIRMSFAIDGRYADVKSLLSDFEKSPRFLVVENLAVSPDAQDPGNLHAALTLTHYFRSADARLGTRVREREGPEPARKPASKGPSRSAVREAASRETDSRAPAPQAAVPAPVIVEAAPGPEAAAPAPEAKHRRHVRPTAAAVPPDAAGVLEAPPPPTPGVQEAVPGPGMRQAPMRGLVIHEGKRKGTP